MCLATFISEMHSLDIALTLVQGPGRLLFLAPRHLSATFIIFPACHASHAANRDRSATNRDRPATNRDRSATNRDRPATNRDCPAQER